MLSWGEFSALPHDGKKVNMISIDKIHKVVDSARKFPNSWIEYNGELPVADGITKDSFYEIKAVYNKNVPTSVGCNLIYKY